MDDTAEVRIHCCLLLDPLGAPLDEFCCIQELLSVFIDIIDGQYQAGCASYDGANKIIVHELLVRECNILHWDISIRNLLMYVFDYGCGEEWPFASKNLNILSRLASKREQILRKHKYRCSLLINFDYTKLMEDESTISEGEQTGTIPFMALDILRAFGPEPLYNTAHKPEHNLESLIYVFIWICVLYTGPGEKSLPAHTTCLEHWVNCKTPSDIESLWTKKTGEVYMQVTLNHFTPYFQCLKPWVQQLYAAIARSRLGLNQTPLTYDILREIFLNGFFNVQEPVADSGVTPAEHTQKILGINP
ncbi:hypothetical protein JVU11DRAFT_2258 [Chiua virens]|nr:hypothetical protein JVU11DRAFT_2258 [Chiua virens]